jgi:hypothetical protein
MNTGERLLELMPFLDLAVRLPMDQIEKYLGPVIQLLPEKLQEYWLVVFGAAALIVLLPLAWYKRLLLRALIRLPRRLVRVELKLDEDLEEFAPPPGLVGSRRLFIEGVPARLRLVVAAPLGKGAALTETAIGEVLDQVRWGLGAIARQDQAAFRIWPVQLSAHGFPAVIHRNIHKPEPEGQPSHWVLLAGPTPLRPHSVLLGLAVFTDQATAIGHLNMDAGQWMKTLSIETVDNQEGVAVPAASEHPAPIGDEGKRAEDNSPPLARTDGGSSA